MRSVLLESNLGCDTTDFENRIWQCIMEDEASKKKEEIDPNIVPHGAALHRLVVEKVKALIKRLAQWTGKN